MLLNEIVARIPEKYREPRHFHIDEKSASALGLRVDSAETVWFNYQLSLMEEQVFKVQYPDLRARVVLPVITRNDSEDFKSYDYRMKDQVGRASKITEWGNDFPRVNINQTLTRVPVIAYGNSFQIGVGEARNANSLGLNLDAELLETARDLFERSINELALTGDSSVSIEGFINNSSVGAASVATVSGSTLWSSKDGAYIVADVAERRAACRTANKSKVIPDTLAVPPAQHELLMSKVMPNSTVSVEQYLRTSMGLNVTWLNELTGAGSGGADRMVLFNANTAYLRMIVNREFDMQPAQPRNMAFVTNAWGSSCGTVIMYPKTIIYGDGI